MAFRQCFKKFFRYTWSDQSSSTKSSTKLLYCPCVPDETKSSPLSVFSPLRDFFSEKFFLQTVPFFGALQQNPCWKIPTKESPLHFFWHCEGFLKEKFLVLKKRLLWHFEAFCHFWAVDIRQLGPVPACFFRRVRSTFFICSRTLT